MNPHRPSRCSVLYSLLAATVLLPVWIWHSAAQEGLTAAGHPGEAPQVDAQRRGPLLEVEQVPVIGRGACIDALDRDDSKDLVIHRISTRLLHEVGDPDEGRPTLRSLPRRPPAPG